MIILRCCAYHVVGSKDDFDLVVRNIVGRDLSHQLSRVSVVVQVEERPANNLENVNNTKESIVSTFIQHKGYIWSRVD